MADAKLISALIVNRELATDNWRERAIVDDARSFTYLNHVFYQVPLEYRARNAL